MAVQCIKAQAGDIILPRNTAPDWYHCLRPWGIVVSVHATVRLTVAWMYPRWFDERGVIGYKMPKIERKGRYSLAEYDIVCGLD